MYYKIMQGGHFTWIDKIRKIKWLKWLNVSWTTLYQKVSNSINFSQIAKKSILTDLMSSIDEGC